MNESHKTITHKPVLMHEVVEYLNLQPGGVYLDVTFGSGGHTRALLEHASDSTVVSLDWDTNAIDTFGPDLVEQYGDRFIPIWANFGNMLPALKKVGKTQLDGILADFGTSQVQIFERAGFSVYRDTPLDMRMSPAHQRLTAAQVVNTFDEKTLREMFYQLGEEKHSKKIAQMIVQHRALAPFETTKQLAQLIERCAPRGKSGGRIHPATRVFQALRMFINQELDNIISFLSVAPKLLKPSGRLVCISFHSLEDRLVKQTFRELEQSGVVQLLTKKVVVASADEVRVNPSSRSAKLRAVAKN
jgi:16S rRNA (cytosine1402-N4)-methyltransferase